MYDPEGTIPEPRILVHLGHSKCGSTSIQHFLASHREDMAERGFLLPRSTKVGTEDQGLSAYVGLERCLLNYAKEHDLGDIDAPTFERVFGRTFVREIEESGAHTVVLSHEGLFPRSPQAMQKLRELLTQVSNDVRCMVILRRQDRWAVSSYNTRLVAHGTSSQDILAQMPGRPHGLMYARQLEEWANCMGEDSLTVAAFEDFTDILEPFLLFIGYRPPGTAGSRQNPGMSAYAQEVVRVLNVKREREGRPAHEERQLRKRLRSILPTGEPQLPAARDARAHLDHFAADNERLKGRFLPPDSRYFADGRSFPEERTVVNVSEREAGEWVERLAEMRRRKKQGGPLATADQALEGQTDGSI